MKNIFETLSKVIEVNFPNSYYKSVLLYNELFISIFYNWEFCLYWISIKADNIFINKYTWWDTKIWKLLLIILKKYEKLFILFLKSNRDNLFNIWEESEFINIFDKKELKFQDIKEKLYFSFLDDYSYRRKIQNEFNFEDSSILDIYHSDFECSKCSWPIETFTSFQNFNDINDKNYFNSSKKENKYLFTNITDYESITVWWNEKINEILQDKTLVDSFDKVLINKTCISVIMWDDIESILKINEIPKERTIYTDQNTDSPYRAVINYLKNLKPNFLNKKDEILLFWLNKNYNTYELVKFLKNNFWINVWNILLPNINKKDLEEIVNYKLAVFFSWREVKAQNIFKLYPISQIELSIPYWITKIKEMLEKISNITWINYFSKLDEILDENHKKNILLYEKSKSFELWFIIFDFHVKQFLNDNFRGLSILSMLNDMWFHLNFFICKTSNIFDKDINEFNQKNDLDKNYNFNTIVSNNKEDLDIFLKSWINCFYSEIANDYRILDIWKEQFSVWDLEYWIDWFYRSFEKLIKKCEKQVYKREILKLN